MIEIVAEISGNHGGDIKNAFLLIEAAKQVGANAVKLQCFDPEKLAARRAENESVLLAAAGRNLGDLYRETVTPKEWFPKLFKLANDVGIEIFSSVFDPDDIPFLIDIGCKRLKIASFEINDAALIDSCCKTGLPLVISASLQTIMAKIMLAMSLVSQNDAFKRTTLLHATNYNYGRITSYDRERIDRLHFMFDNDLSVGLSDHSASLWKPESARAILTHDIKMIEAHICLPDLDTPDTKFSYLPTEFQAMVQNVRQSESRPF